MKQHRMAALAAAAALAITSTVIAVPVQAAPEELMNSTFEDGYGAWKGVGSTISITHTMGTVLCMSLTEQQTGVHLAAPCPALPYRGRPIPFLLMLCLQMGTIIRTWH